MDRRCKLVLGHMDRVEMAASGLCTIMNVLHEISMRESDDNDTDPVFKNNVNLRGGLYDAADVLGSYILRRSENIKDILTEE